METEGVSVDAGTTVQGRGLAGVTETSSSTAIVKDILDNILNTFDKDFMPMLPTSSEVTGQVPQEEGKASPSKRKITIIRKSDRPKKQTSFITSDVLSSEYEKRLKAKSTELPLPPIWVATADDVLNANSGGVKPMEEEEYNGLIKDLYPGAVGYWHTDYGFYRPYDGVDMLSEGYEKLVALGVYDKLSGGEVSWCMFGDYVYVYSIEQRKLNNVYMCDPNLLLFYFFIDSYVSCGHMPQHQWGD